MTKHKSHHRSTTNSRSPAIIFGSFNRRKGSRKKNCSRKNGRAVFASDRATKEIHFNATNSVLLRKISPCTNAVYLNAQPSAIFHYKNTVFLSKFYNFSQNFKDSIMKEEKALCDLRELSKLIANVCVWCFLAALTLSSFFHFSKLQRHIGR